MYTHPLPDNVVDIVTRIRAGRSRQEILLFSQKLRPAMGPTQPPIQRVARFFPRG